MSHRAPWGRTTPRWSVPGAAVQATPSSAGLPVLFNRVWVGPPWLARGPSCGLPVVKARALMSALFRACARPSRLLLPLASLVPPLRRSSTTSLPAGCLVAGSNTLPWAMLACISSEAPLRVQLMLPPALQAAWESPRL